MWQKYSHIPNQIKIDPTWYKKIPQLVKIKIRVRRNRLQADYRFKGGNTPETTLKITLAVRATETTVCFNTKSHFTRHKIL